MDVSRTDEQLVLDYRRGDQQAMDELIRRHLKPIHTFVFRLTGDRHEAEDITQETFLKAWRHLWRFNAGKKFRPWLFRIAKNATTDHFRRKRTLPFSAFEDEDGNNPVTDGLTDPAPLPDELLARKDAGQVLTDALNRLPLIYRQVMLLRHNDHFSFIEIAETMGEPLNTVKSRHRRALLCLRKELDKGTAGDATGNAPNPA